MCYLLRHNHNVPRGTLMLQMYQNNIYIVITTFYGIIK